MRKRSESFYAKSEDEFTKIKTQKECHRKRSKIVNLQSQEITGNEIFEQKEEEIPKSFNYFDDMDELGVEKEFKLKKDAPSMKEVESNFLDSMDKINFSVKTKDKTQFIHHLSSVYGYLLKEKKSLKNEEINLEERNSRTNSKVSKGSDKKSGKMVRSITYSNLESLNINFDLIKSLDYNSLSAESTSHNSFNSIFINPLIKNNLDVVDDVMKLMVIGDTRVGKSYFINKFFEDEVEITNSDGKDKNSRDNLNEYIHTNSLEIKKKMVKLLGKNICLEMWDTNLEIMSNEICKVYFKICDGFILIVDPTKIETVLFIEKQIERILKVSSNPNFYLIANITFSNLNFEKLKDIKKKFIETDILIKLLVDKYEIKLQYINLDDLSFFRNALKKFLTLSYVKKGMPGFKTNNKKERKTLPVNKTDRRSVNYTKEDAFKI